MENQQLPLFPLPQAKEIVEGKIDYDNPEIDEDFFNKFLKPIKDLRFVDAEYDIDFSGDFIIIKRSPYYMMTNNGDLRYSGEIPAYAIPPEYILNGEWDVTKVP